MEGPSHGVNGWRLVRYEWNDRTGEAKFWYRHRDGGKATAVRTQPYYAGFA